MSRRFRQKASHFYGAGRTPLSPFPGTEECSLPGWQALPDWGPSPRIPREGRGSTVPIFLLVAPAFLVGWGSSRCSCYAGCPALLPPEGAVSLPSRGSHLHPRLAIYNSGD